MLLFVSGLFYLYFTSNNSSTTNNSQQNSNNTNLFGNTSGNKDNSVSGNSNQSGFLGQNNNDFNQKNNKLFHLYNNPVSGSIFTFNKNKEGILRFIDRANGNVYQYVLSKQTGEVDRLTNTTIPKVQEALWSNSGNNLIYRYLDGDTENIISFLAEVKAGPLNTVGEVTGSFITKNIAQVVSSPAGDKFIELLNKENGSGSYIVSISNDIKNSKQIFTSPLKDWIMSWPKDNLITISSKPSYKYVGYLYFFNTQTQSMDRILGDIAGMTTLTNKDASLVAYSYNNNSTVSLDIYNISEKNTKKLNIATLSDKCVWGNTNSKTLYCAIPKNIPSDNYPDSWYQGLVSFDDDIWKINTETGSMDQIYSIGLNENANIDVLNIKISQDDKFLTFSNKNDLSLWLLDINQE